MADKIIFPWSHSQDSSLSIPHSQPLETRGRAGFLMLISLRGLLTSNYLNMFNLLYQVLQLATVRVSSPGLLTLRPLFYKAQVKVGTILHSSQSWCFQSAAWTLVVTYPCCYRATHQDMAPSGSTGQDPTTCQLQLFIVGVPHYLPVSSSSSLYCTHSLLFFFLFYFSTTYLFNFVAPGTIACLRSIKVTFTWPI